MLFLDLPNDVIEKIRNVYFIEYVKPDMLRNAPWMALQGCKSNFLQIRFNCFLADVVEWAASYLHSFYPRIAMNELRGGAEFREYNRTHKYCWVDVVDIDVGTKGDSRSMTDIKLWFQQEFNVVLRNRSIRLEFKSRIKPIVQWALNHSNIEIDSTIFEWKPLTLKIDFVDECAYFVDPSDGRKSRRTYKRNGEHVAVEDPIPWLVFFP